MNEDSSERHKERKSEKLSDGEEIKEIFDALNESIPKLISGVIGSVYNPEAAGNMAASIGRFYTKLKEEGIPEDVALDMTKKFVGALDFEKMMNLVSDESSSKRRRSRHHNDDDEESE
ncbi:MAG: hypothetical protein ACTSU3_06665 [Candidatus Thorarchaeota archaeon]